MRRLVGKPYPIPRSIDSLSAIPSGADACLWRHRCANISFLIFTIISIINMIMVFSCGSDSSGLAAISDRIDRCWLSVLATDSPLLTGSRLLPRSFSKGRLGSFSNGPNMQYEQCRVNWSSVRSNFWKSSRQMSIYTCIRSYRGATRYVTARTPGNPGIDKFWGVKRTPPAVPLLALGRNPSHISHDVAKISNRYSVPNPCLNRR